MANEIIVDHKLKVRFNDERTSFSIVSSEVMEVRQVVKVAPYVYFPYNGRITGVNVLTCVNDEHLMYPEVTGFSASVDESNFVEYMQGKFPESELVRSLVPVIVEEGVCAS